MKVGKTKKRLIIVNIIISFLISMFIGLQMSEIYKEEKLSIKEKEEISFFMKVGVYLSIPSYYFFTLIFGFKEFYLDIYREWFFYVINFMIYFTLIFFMSYFIYNGKR